MNRKTKQLLARIIVFILSALLILSAIMPYVFGAEKYVTYSNKKLHMKFKIPASAKSGMDTISENGREFPIDFYLTARVIYGDIYEEVLAKNKLSKSSLDRSEVYIKSKYVADTWNNKAYVTKYFKSILSDAKSGYTCEVTPAKLSGIPAWRCYYKGTETKSGGYYFLTLTNGGLHVLQLDCYLKDLSSYKGTIKKIKESYRITDLVIPGKTTQKKAGGKSEQKPVGTATDPTGDDNQQKEKLSDRINLSFSKPAKIILIALSVLMSIGIVFLLVKNYVTSGKYDKAKEERKRNRKLKVTRKNNTKIE